jgi:methyl-accepting chemotaxis protein
MKIRTSLLLSLGALTLVISSLVAERAFFASAFERATVVAAAAKVASATIELADEQLTMSASMAAVTGEPKWVERYNSVTAEMDAGIVAALAIASPAVAEKFNQETKQANDKLIEMEKNVLSAVRLGDLVTAQAVINSSEYAEQKKLLAAGTSHFLMSIKDASKGEVDRVINFGNTLALGLACLSAVVVGFGASVVVFGVSRPLNRMESVMRQLASGDIEVKVPYVGVGNEVGGMAVSVQEFKNNARIIRNMAEEERSSAERRAQERTLMMQSLQQAFSHVVDGAAQGEFDRRVELNFSDGALNELGASVNNLVATVAEGLTNTASVLSALARSDLTKRMEGSYKGAFAALQQDTNAVVESFSSVVGQLRSTSQAVRVATEEILVGSNDLADRTSRQAATVEETSAAMEQLQTGVVGNSDLAHRASERAAAVSTLAQDGGAVMRRSNDAMVRITESSSKISSIIGLIDDIAFQTNLLALNASVEAARAGDAGKGFAVVAVEVRRLAQSAARASADVKELIETSRLEVAAGGRLVAEATDKLELVVAGIRESSDMLATIAMSASEQSDAILEVSRAVRQMDEITQHNAALVEQTNAAIEQTETQVRHLDQIINVFHVPGPNARSVLQVGPRLVA